MNQTNTIKQSVFGLNGLTGILVRVVSSLKTTLQLVSIAASLFFSVSLHAAKPFDFSNNLTVDHHEEPLTLLLTGQAMRSKFVFSVYDIAHYSDSLSPLTTTRPTPDEDVFDNILQSGGTKQISMVFRRDLKASQIQKALSEGVKSNCVGDEYERVAADLETFRTAINQNVKKHDRFVMRWLPDGKLISIYEDEVISEIDNAMLARLLWSIWFGENSVVDRDKLVEKLTRDV